MNLYKMDINGSLEGEKLKTSYPKLFEAILEEFEVATGNPQDLFPDFFHDKEGNLYLIPLSKHLGDKQLRSDKIELKTSHSLCTPENLQCSVTGKVFDNGSFLFVYERLYSQQLGNPVLPEIAWEAGFKVSKEVCDMIEGVKNLPF